MTRWTAASVLPRVPQLRLLAPLLLTSTVSLALCVGVAAFLLREQAQSAESVAGAVAMYRESARLEESIADLIALGTKVEDVRALHTRIETHLADIQVFARSPEEKAIRDRLLASFREYLVRWRTVTKSKKSDPVARAEAVRILETETLPICQELRDDLNRQIDNHQQEHRSNVRSLAWGLAAVGGTAILGGLLLGYGVSRGLHQSIQRLQIGIRDAAGKLAPAFPTIEVSGESNLNELNVQMQFLIERIEQTVERLQQSERELLRAEQLAAVGQLAAGMAHEIRNPLMSIKLLIQTAREEGPKGGLSGEDLGVIDREIRQMQRSIQSFLDFARPPKLHKAKIELTPIVEQTLALLHGRAGKQRVTIAFEKPTTPVPIEADAIQLQQVFLNLGLNALDVMPTGGTLTFGLRQSGEWVEVRVSDTGAGIPDEARERLFHPFFTTKPTGLGLGLVISRRIVEDHGGRLECDTAKAPGACFLVLLPIFQA